MPIRSDPDAERRAALDVAVRALAGRALSEDAVRARLRRAGVTEEVETETIETLARLGYTDDGRLACERAAVLAGRGYGDAAVEAKLLQEGVSAEHVHIALAGLELEEARARHLAVRECHRGPVRLARLLAQRGFGADAIEAALAGLDAPGPPSIP